jgi:L-threonylcarbamoyladenylate synthase
LTIPEQLVRTITDGGIAVIPTDTCYGLAADALNERAVSRVGQLKGRPPSRPPAAFVPDVSTIGRLTVVSHGVLASLQRLLPGPYTVLLPAASWSPPWLVGKKGLVGIRCVCFALVKGLLVATGRLLTATSANRTGLSQPYTPEELERVLPIMQVDYVMPQPCGGLPPSTVIDMSREPFVVLREGAVSKKELLETMQLEES